MIYLDERISVTVSDFSWVGTHEAGMYRYFIFDNADPATNLFVGNLYLEKNQYEVTVDITDIARNYCASTNKIVMLEVGIKFSAGEPSGISEPIVPIYRYPNAKADDNKYNFDSYDTFLVSGKQIVKNFNYSSSLLPTYPQRVTDKIKIDYLLGLKSGTGTDSFTFDYGPTQTISNTLTNSPTLYNISYPLADGTKTVTDVNPLTDFMWAWGGIYEPIASFEYSDNKNWAVYSYNSTVTIDEINWQFAGGTSNYDTPSKYPYSLTISDTDYNSDDTACVCDFYIQNFEYGDIVNTYPAIEKGHYTCDVKCDISEELKTLDCSGIDWDYWEYKNNYYINTSYNNLKVGSTLISVRFTDTEGNYVVELDETFPSEGVTWEWDQTTTEITEAKIYFDGTEYETTIPLEIVNSQGDYDTDYKNIVFTLENNNSVPVLYINYSNYSITIKYSATLNKSIEAPLADDIVAYSSDKYSFVETDDNYTLEVEGDLEIENNFVANKYLCKDIALTFYQNGVATNSRYLSGNTVSLIIKNTPIDDSYFLVQYFDTSNNYREGKVYIKPTNPQSNSYFLTNFYIKLLSNNTFIGKFYSGVHKKFGYQTNAATKIGQFGCPSGYYLIWKDRLCSQQIQPFHKVDTYSEDIEGSEITNYWGKRSLYKVEVQPKWKVQTGWISDEAYRCYEGLFVSPYVKLYDADSDIIYDVIIKDRNYTQKTFLNQGKLFNLEVTLEQSEKQNILY